MAGPESKRTCIAPLTALALACTAVGTAGAAELNLGRVATPTEIAGWDINVFPDGTGLPSGRATVAQGKVSYQDNCASCHGDKLEGGFGPALTGGRGSLTTEKPMKTVGSYWPYPSTLFDYIRRAMPFQAPQSLSNDEVYALTGYILHVNGLMDPDATIDAKSLIALRMPNRDAFYVDDRPDVNASRCMKDCLSKAAATP